MFNNPRKTLMLLGALLLLVGGIITWRQLNPPLTDQEQIAANLEDIRTSIQSRNTNRVLGYLTKDFSFQGMNQKEIRMAMVGTLRDWRDVQLNVSSVNTEVQADTATSAGHYTLSYSTGRGGASQPQSGEFKLKWQKREGKWLITQVEGPANMPE